MTGSLYIRVNTYQKTYEHRIDIVKIHAAVSGHLLASRLVAARTAESHRSMDGMV